MTELPAPPPVRSAARLFPWPPAAGIGVPTAAATAAGIGVQAGGGRPRLTTSRLRWALIVAP
jgi:hypothetical protein